MIKVQTFKWAQPLSNVAGAAADPSLTDVRVGLLPLGVASFTLSTCFRGAFLAIAGAARASVQKCLCACKNRVRKGGGKINLSHSIFQTEQN
jgi:hypothetical protein